MYDGKYVLEPIKPRRDNDLKEAPAKEAPEDIREHPMWLRLREAILRALMPFAEARAALVLALNGVQPVSSP